MYFKSGDKVKVKDEAAVESLCEVRDSALRPSGGYVPQLKFGEEIFDKYSEYFLNGDEHISNISIEEDIIEIKWEVYWSYGGYDCGSFSIPISDFCGDYIGWIDNKIQQDKDKKIDLQKKNDIIKKNKELKLLEELQRKYNENK